MRKVLLFCAVLCSCIPGISAEKMKRERALERLKEGNERYVQDALEHSNRDLEWREAVAAKQAPFAIIVGCSDSRVSPEILFDQGVGDLFVVRVAGNVIGALELDSINYAALYLGSCCIVVLGHENCGAVKAVIEGTTRNIGSIAKLAGPAVKEAKRSVAGDLLRTSIQKNAELMKEHLLQSKAIQRLVKEGAIDVHAAYYNLDSGAVEWL